RESSRKAYSPKLREPARRELLPVFCCVQASGAPRVFRLKMRRMSRSGSAPNGVLMQPMAAGTRGRLGPTVLGLFFTMDAATSTCPRRIGLRGGAIAAYGANSYGARRTWRQAAGRSAIRGPGLGLDGGDGLGWSTASVNQYASSLPQPSSAGRGGCGVHSALSEGQTSRTWK